MGQFGSNCILSELQTCDGLFWSTFQKHHGSLNTLALQHQQCFDLFLVILYVHCENIFFTNACGCLCERVVVKNTFSLPTFLFFSLQAVSIGWIQDHTGMGVTRGKAWQRVPYPSTSLRRWAGIMHYIASHYFAIYFSFTFWKKNANLTSRSPLSLFIHQVRQKYSSPDGDYS